MKETALLAILITFMLISTPFLPIFGQTRALVEPSTSSSTNQSEPFKPTMSKPAWIDKDNDGIADTLNWEIADRMANGTAQEYVNVTVMLKTAPTIQDTVAFFTSGGCLTTELWKDATYGFGGTIPYDRIADFIRQCPDALLVEKEAVGKVCVAYAAQQVGARTYVWNTLGLQGDPNSSIAVLDTGIDGSHPDFSPGYGDQDFSKKIVGWNDQVGSTTSPVDDAGHGSHCSGLAAGSGFFSTDSSGNAITTWGRKLKGGNDGWYPIDAGMMVNKTGLIVINVGWAATGSTELQAIILLSGNTTDWTFLTGGYTPSQGTFYSFTYNVTSIPPCGYEMYHLMINQTAGTGDLFVALTMSWPYTLPSDGFSAWTGIAPQSKLVGVKVADSGGHVTSTAAMHGINWVTQNRIAYHITVASISWGFDEVVGQLNMAVLSLVGCGICTVVAAGNNESGANYIFTPGSVNEVITVAAMSQFDCVASYSSQGGPSQWNGATVKPDIAAPGGSIYAVPLFSADSNYDDAQGAFQEIQANDSAPMVGTSMAAPIIAGCAQVVVQAMGGYSKWNWTMSQALQPKMILLMTATETYPNLREYSNSSASPTLDRGGKDVHEGYGRVNLDVAVDAILKTYDIGSVVTDALGSPPTLDDISVLGQKLAWARNVQLVSGCAYNFCLSVPTGADYDMYLYNSTGNSYGEPVIVAKSTNATTGGSEQFWVAPPYTGTYYLVVKRATETTESGNFTLSTNALCAMKTKTDALPIGFYVPNATFINATVLKVEKLFDNTNLTGDQTGITCYPDGKVDMRDVAFVAKKFGKTEGDAGWDYMADVYPDRKIDTHDTAIVSQNYGRPPGSYINDTSTGVLVLFDTGPQESPDANGFVAIPQGASSFYVTRNNATIGAMIIFYGP